MLTWLLEPFTYAFMQRGLAAGVLVGLTCAVLSAFVVLRGMAFVGDAMAHTILPGVVVAFLRGGNLFVGALVAGVLTALGIGFLLLLLVVQVGAAMAAREAAQAVVATAARRAARPHADFAAEQQRLADRIVATVPGAGQITTTVRRAGRDALASARFRWIPPGPDWVPITIRVGARVPAVVPP